MSTRGRQHGVGMSLPAVTRRDLIADVAAALAEFPGQVVADHHRPQVNGPVDVPEGSDRHAPGLLLVEDTAHVAGEVRRYLVDGEIREPALVTQGACGRHERVGA